MKRHFFTFASAMSIVYMFLVSCTSSDGASRKLNSSAEDYESICDCIDSFQELMTDFLTEYEKTIDELIDADYDLYDDNLTPSQKKKVKEIFEEINANFEKRTNRMTKNCEDLQNEYGDNPSRCSEDILEEKKLVLEHRLKKFQQRVNNMERRSRRW
jgi:exonuclease VII large subunit